MFNLSSARHVLFIEFDIGIAMFHDPSLVMGITHA